ncbi:hypothetical protein H8B20_07295 [Pseudomonas sp. P42]|nr:hypothetical protein [Pseudomonas sp. P42]
MRQFNNRLGNSSVLGIARHFAYESDVNLEFVDGKSPQVQGFIKAFEEAARFNGEALHQLQEYEIPLVGLDPAMTLVYHQEYAKTLGSHKVPTVLLPQEWLANTLPQSQIVKDADPYHFLPLCTEKTNEPNSIVLWQQVYERMGLKMSV